METNKENLMLSIVIPVYNSELILYKLVEEIATAMTGETYAKLFELVLINDGSPDDSWNKICALAKKYSFVKGVSLRKNFGQHNATMAGLNYCGGSIVVIMDDDLQHPPAAINRMIEAINSGYDVCYTHYLNRKHPLWKKLGSKFNGWIATKLLNKPDGLYLSSFKALRRAIVDEVIKYDGPYAYIDGLILDVTRSVTAIDIEHQARIDGDGNYNIRSSLSLWLKMATSFSVLPLRFASYAGIFLAIISFIMMIVVLLQKLMYPEIQAGWASIIAVILFIGGVQTLCIGVIGEYLGRAYLRINGKPQYSVSETTHIKEKLI